MYPREVRENAIEMIKNGKRVYSVARELGIPLTHSLHMGTPGWNKDREENYTD